MPHFAWTLIAACAADGTAAPPVSAQPAPPPFADLDVPPPPPKPAEAPAAERTLPPVPKAPAIAASSAAASPAEKKVEAPDSVPMPAPPADNGRPISLSKPRPQRVSAARSANPPPASAAEKPIPAPQPKVIRMDGSHDVIARSIPLPAPATVSSSKLPKPRAADEPIRRTAAGDEPGGVVAAIAPKDQPAASVSPAVELVTPQPPRFQIVQVSHDAEDRRMDATKGPPKKLAYAPAPEVNSYTIELWDSDGWETLPWLARTRYKAAEYAPALAKFNRYAGKLDAPLPRGTRVRLPPPEKLEPLLAGTDRNAARIDSTAERSFLIAPEEAAAFRGGTVVASSRLNAAPENGPPRTAVAAAEPRPLPVRPGAAATSTSALPPRPALDREYVVEDARTTLYMIAQRRLGDPGRKDELYRLNQNVLSGPDDVLRVGTRLRLPDDAVLRR